VVRGCSSVGDATNLPFPLSGQPRYPVLPFGENRPIYFLDAGQRLRMDAGSYSKYQHRHNFSVWAAARAAQRAFTDVETLRTALEASDIKSFIQEPCGRAAFDEAHKTWCGQIIGHLQEVGISKATYGRAAKLVNVYLKSMIVLRDLESEEADYIHPPIDRILLKSLARDESISASDRKILREIRWTKLTEKGYFDLIGVLKRISA